MSSSGASTSCIVKILVIGNPGVGKTSFVKRYAKSSFCEQYDSTIGVDFMFKDVYWQPMKKILRVQLWDIAGQERTTCLTRAYYKGSSGCVLLFDLTDRQSFIEVVKWKREFDRKCQLGGGLTIPILLIGNKCEMPNRQVNGKDIHGLAEQFYFSGFAEVSVKMNTGVEEAMKTLLEMVMEDRIDPSSAQQIAGVDSMHVSLSRDDLQHKTCNC